MGSLVAAFIAKGLLIIPREKTMPGEKIGLNSSQHITYLESKFETFCAVDKQGLVHMNSDKVIISRLGSGNDARRELGRLGLQTQDSICILLSLAWSHLCPKNQASAGFRWFRSLYLPFLANRDIVQSALARSTVSCLICCELDKTTRCQ